jgi:predicted acyltransferase
MTAREKTKRLVALDAFRGITILFMIIVNTPGTWEHVWPPLEHSPWHGCTPTDLVFPYFLFIVGVAMWFSFRKYGHRLNGGALWRITRRVAGIFLLGLLLNALAADLDWSHLRIPGVLQRIALTYGLAAFLVLLLPRGWRWAVAALILLGYWGVLLYFGGDHPFDLMTNVVRRVDLSLLGPAHMYHGFPLNSTDKVAFDPEGLLSTLPATVNVIIGYQMGEMIGHSKDHFKTSLALLVFGILGIGMGLLWDLYFPINKPLWSSSYVLFTSGWASLWLGIMLWAVDVKGWTKPALPLVAAGMNPLFLYVLAGLWTYTMLRVSVGGTSLYAWIYQHLFVSWLGNTNFASFMFAFTDSLLFCLIGCAMYKKKIFIKI